jgi:tight adherence protein C
MIAAGLLVFGLVVAAGLWPRWRLRRVEQQHRLAIDDAFAEVADVLIVVLGAGSSLTEGIWWLAERGPEETRSAFASVIDRASAGQPLTVALSGVSDDLGSAYRPMVAALTATIRDGAPTSSLLLRLGDEARAVRRRQNERRARSVPVQMLFPLVCCSLPAVIVGTVLPLVLIGVDRL